MDNEIKTAHILKIGPAYASRSRKVYREETVV